MTALESSLCLLGPKSSSSQVCFIIEWPLSRIGRLPPLLLKKLLGGLCLDVVLSTVTICSSICSMQRAVVQGVLDC